MTSVDLNMLVEDAVDALIRIADAVTKEVGSEMEAIRAEAASLRERNLELEDQLAREED